MNESSFTLADGDKIRYHQRGRHGKKNARRELNRDFVRGVINSIFYTGQVPYYSGQKHGTLKAVYPGKHPAIISQETFQKVQEVRTLLYKNVRAKKGGPIRLYPLTGILHCASCGWSMRGTSTKGRFYYADSARIARKGICDQRLVDAEQIESELVNYLLAMIENWRETVKPEDILSLISEIETHIEQTRTLFLCRDITLETYEAVRDREIAQLEILREMGLNAILTQSISLKGKLSSWNSTLSIDKKRQLRLVIEAVWLQDNAIVALQPTFAFLPLFSQEQGSCKSGPDESRAFQ
ncbi:MAG: recombinase family protein [Anaerolineales bacterium]|nr:recombinase family protein [Anaerolineales bacterium]